MNFLSLDIFKPKFPLQALEISGKYVLGIRLEKTKTETILEHFFCDPLPEGVLDVSMVKQNIGKAEQFLTFMGPKLDGFAEKKRRLSLILPDIIAKVSVLEFDRLPSKRAEVEDLIKWKLKKAIPFKVEEGKIVFREIMSGDGSGMKTSLLVAAIRNTVLEQYEKIFGQLNFYPGLIDLSSFNVMNLCRRLKPEIMGEPENYLFLNIAENYYTISILKRGNLLFYRAKVVRGDSVSTEDLFMRALDRDFFPTLVYFQDKLQGGEIKRIFLRNFHFQGDALKAFMEERFHIPVDYVDPAGLVKPQPSLAVNFSDFQRMAPLLGAVLAR